jgi:hypothetical protein
MENLNSRPNSLTIIGRAIANYADRSTAFIAARLERTYQAHMERAQMRLAPSPMAMCTERPHVSAESDSRVGENNSQNTGSGDHFCLVVIDESGSIEATGARGGDIGIGDVQDVPNARSRTRRTRWPSLPRRLQARVCVPNADSSFSQCGDDPRSRFERHPNEEGAL